MKAVADQDHPVLERWAGMADAETAAVQDVHLGARRGRRLRRRGQSMHGERPRVLALSDAVGGATGAERATAAAELAEG